MKNKLERGLRVQRSSMGLDHLATFNWEPLPKQNATTLLHGRKSRQTQRQQIKKYNTKDKAKIGHGRIRTCNIQICNLYFKLYEIFRKDFQMALTWTRK
jgi:hypothetical protein